MVKAGTTAKNTFAFWGIGPQRLRSLFMNENVLLGNCLLVDVGKVASQSFRQNIYPTSNVNFDN